MRSVRVGSRPDASVLEAADMNASMAQDMYRLLALAKYQDRYVIPTAKGEAAKNFYALREKVGYPEGDTA
jgi:nitrate reductase beta subunit